MIRLVDHLKWQIDKAIEMLDDPSIPRYEVTIFLRKFQKSLLGKDKVIIDEDKTKYLESEETKHGTT